MKVINKMLKQQLFFVRKSYGRCGITTELKEHVQSNFFPFYVLYFGFPLFRSRNPIARFPSLGQNNVFGGNWNKEHELKRKALEFIPKRDFNNYLAFAYKS